ncbi:MAG TPA: hypothetical protein VHJ76_07310 [Actinomycetota bacterium]|nr:hypothetical protein [Actinomycetota bacterium]
MKIAALAVCLLLAACSDDPERAAMPTPAPPAVDPACPNQEAVVGDASLRAGTPASGDVDGDGEPEEVAIHVDPDGPAGCLAFVVAESSGGSLAGPLETWREDFGLPVPTINTLVDVDGEPGDEVVVNMGIGASTQFVGIVTARDGALVQVTTRGLEDAGEGVFGFGGSVGHVEAVDCTGSGEVVSSFAAPAGKRYRVERRYLDFDGTKLVFDRREVERIAIEELDRLPEYPASPFGSCS